MRRRIAVILVLATTAVALLGACGGDEEAGDFADVDARDLLARSADRMEQVDSFAFEVEHENGSTQIVGGIRMERAEGRVQGTERMQLEVEARFASTNIRTGIVILPGEGYLQNPITGRWERQDGIDISSLFDPATGVTGLMRAATDVEVVDREDADGVDSYVVESTVDSGNLQVFVGNAAPGNPVNARVWIGVEDLLVRQIEVVGPLAPNDASDILRRLTLSDFDEVVEITAPN